MYDSNEEESNEQQEPISSAEGENAIDDSPVNEDAAPHTQVDGSLDVAEALEAQANSSRFSWSNIVPGTGETHQFMIVAISKEMITNSPVSHLSLILNFMKNIKCHVNSLSFMDIARDLMHVSFLQDILV